MRRPVVYALAALLALSVAGATGCDMLEDPTKDANAAIAEANLHFKNYQASNAKVKELAEELSEQDGPEKALEAIGALKNELEIQKHELQEAAKDISKIKKLEVDDSFKRYADLEIAAIEAEIAVIEEGAKLYDETERMEIAIRDKKATTSLTSEIRDNIDSSSLEISALETAATEAWDAAATFFDEMNTDRDR